MTHSVVITRDVKNQEDFYTTVDGRTYKSIGWDEQKLASTLNGILQLDHPSNATITVYGNGDDFVWLSASYDLQGKLDAAEVIVGDNSEFIARMLRLRDGEWSTDENGMFSWENGDVPRGSAISILGFYRK